MQVYWLLLVEVEPALDVVGLRREKCLKPQQSWSDPLYVYEVSRCPRGTPWLWLVPARRCCPKWG